MYSDDFFLCGKAMVALARLDDKKSIREIEHIVQETGNPRIIIHGALALEIFKSIPSIKLLLEKIKKLPEKMHPDLYLYVRDEIILAISGIIGMDSFFYPLYRAYKKNGLSGFSDLLAVF